jgi:hypothetical protein
MKHEREGGTVPIYEPRTGEYGHVAKLRRVNGLRALEHSGIISYETYEPGSPPEFVIHNAEGAERRPTGREVPVYLLGAADLMLAVNRDMPDIVNAAFARPSVMDRETLAEAILAELEVRFGTAVREAAQGFEPHESTPELAAVS